MPLKNFSQSLRAGFGLRIAGRHAVADIKVANYIDWKIDRFAVALPNVRNRTNATCRISGIEIDQRGRGDAAFRVVERLKFRGK